MRLTLLIGPVLSGSVLLAAWDFAQRMTSSDTRGLGSETGVVFTGQFDRVHVGLDLLRDGRLERLFISGVNPGAGVDPKTFADQFGFDATLETALETGRLALGPHAQTTTENAVETACWYKAQNLKSPLLLITTDLHMPRASLALERALPGVPVLRGAIPSTVGARLRPDPWAEFAKFLGTFVIASQRSDSRCPDVGSPEGDFGRDKRT